MNEYGIKTYKHGEPIQRIQAWTSHIIWNISVFEAEAKHAESASDTSS